MTTGAGWTAHLPCPRLEEGRAEHGEAETIGNPSATPVRRCPGCSQLTARLLSAGMRDSP
ncbi:MAG: hypothetical protein R3E42_15960 [Burkholderiaceae bacterium]